MSGEHSEEQVGGERQLQALVASQGRTSYAGSKRSYMWSLSSVMDPILWWHAEPQDWRETFSSEPSEVESKASCSFRWGGFSFSLPLSFILNLTEWGVENWAYQGKRNNRHEVYGEVEAVLLIDHYLPLAMNLNVLVWSWIVCQFKLSVSVFCQSLFS